MSFEISVRSDHSNGRHVSLSRFSFSAVPFSFAQVIFIILFCAAVIPFAIHVLYGRHLANTNISHIRFFCFRRYSSIGHVVFRSSLKGLLL